MKIKKFVVCIATLISISTCNSLFAAEVSDSDINKMIQLYKGENYIGCVNSSNQILEENPSNIFAYYYKGLAYTQLGKKEDAMTAFEQVISINSNSTLVDYAKKANACLSSPEDCAKYEKGIGELEAFIKSKKFFSDNVQSQVNQKKLDRIRENINDEVNNVEKKSEMPTNDEIANAVKTLAKAGINPLANISQGYQNPQMMQMSMLLNDNNNNYNMNMLPMLLMNQNSNQQLPPDLIQTMMMTQMSPAL